MESRQPKRMKKRRDLDKLLANSGRGPHLYKKRSLVGEITSSEDAESPSSIRQPSKVILAYRRPSCCNSRCWIAAVVTTLVFCITALAVLGWLCIQLTKQLDYVQHKLYSLDHLQYEVKDVVLRLFESERVMASMSSDLPRLEANVTDLFQQLIIFNTTIRQLDETVDKAPDLWTLPRQLKQLSKLVAELGSSVESLREQELLTNQRLNLLDGELQNLLINFTSNVLSCKLLERNFNESTMQLSIMNATLWRQITDLVNDTEQQKSMAAQMMNETDSLHVLFNAVREQVSRLSVVIKDTVHDETASQLINLSLKLQNSNAGLVSQVQHLKDRLDNLHLQSTNAVSMDDLKLSVAQLAANVTHQLMSLRDITQRLTVIELTVDDIMPSRRGEQHAVGDVIPSRHGESHAVALSHADNRLIELGRN